MTTFVVIRYSFDSP